MVAALILCIGGLGVLAGLLYEPAEANGKAPEPAVSVAPKPAKLKAPKPKPTTPPKEEKSERVSLTVSTIPSGAKAYGPGDELLGETQLTVPRPKASGSYKITLRHKGYREMIVEFGTGSDSKQERRLIPIEAPRKPVVS